ncbi:adenosine receptor A3-like [Actinia tenebrosa]|uniref:Adenosine receptor A3-like n=1 Tax=Actinia tenebrosa TaxID=6105 RepID=A0A6P8IPX8_ACTTE|nr:adenosine receptor A3-like [Actinia tenebrosa]XP_031568933.1 adenosine receptor A3-like [Actinia tenebrosa]
MNGSNSTVLRNPSVGLLWCSAFSFQAIGILVSNCMTIVTFGLNKHLRKRSVYLLINLSIADFLVGILPLPLYIYIVGLHYSTWSKPSPRVHVIIYHGYHYLDIFTGLTSIMNLALISLERMLATVWPLRHRVTTSRAYVSIIISTWIFAAMVAAVTTYINGFFEDHAVYAAWVPFSFLLSSLFLIIISYSVVFANFKLCSQRMAGKNRVRQNHYQNKKLAKTLLIVSAASILAWFPFAIINGIHYYTYLHINETALNVIKLLHYMNSLINTFIYASRMPEFRAALFRLTCKCCRLGQNSMTKPPSIHMIDTRNNIVYGRVQDSTVKNLSNTPTST